jgi:hypothetical protein
MRTSIFGITAASLVPCLRAAHLTGGDAGWALILWLMALPAATAGGAVDWALRRRTTLLSDI